MLRTLRPLIIATAILSLFSLFLAASEAIEITEMYSTYDDSEARGCLYITSYVATDSPYLFVYWYIDGVQQSISGGPSTSAYFSPNSSEFPGSSDGTTYTIEAVAYQYDPETNLMLSDSDSYDVTVYTPCLTDEAALTATVISCSWDGQTASASGKATFEHIGAADTSDVNYTLKFSMRVLQLDRFDNEKATLFSDSESKSGRASPGNSDTFEKGFSYSLGNGWEGGDTFRVEAHTSAWARTAVARAKAKLCEDTDSSDLTIPEN